MSEYIGYFDESYGTADAYSVAGYVATVEQWKAFTAEWRELAKQEKFSVLHKVDLEHNIKGTRFEWPNLTDRAKSLKKKRINGKACKIILNHLSAAFGASVQKSEWESQVAKGSKWGDLMGRSFYAAGVWTCLNMVGAWADERQVDLIQYVFEEGADGRHEAELMLRKLKKDPHDRLKYRIRDYSFGSKKEPSLVPLQAADFLAYESYRHIDNRIVQGIKIHKGKPLEPRGVLRCLLRADDPRYTNVHPLDLPLPYHGIWLDKDSISELLEGLNGAFADFPVGTD